MTRARLPLLAGPVVAALLAVAPPPAGAQPAVTPWHAYSGAEAAVLRQAIRAFRRAHPGIEVHVLMVPFGAYATKLEQAIPTGEGPDVFIDAHERLATYVEAGLRDPYGPLDGFADG